MPELQFADLPTIRDERGGLAFVQSPDHLHFVPDAAAWRTLAPDQRMHAPALGDTAWLVGAGTIRLDAPSEVLHPYGRLVIGPVIGTAGPEGATVVVLARSDQCSATPAAPVKGAVNECRHVPIVQMDGWAVARSQGEIPFAPVRAYFLYDVPIDAARGAHAHIALHQLFVAIRGSFVLELFDGTTHRTVTLADPWTALYVPPGLWRDLRGFDDGAVCMVLASHAYDPADYLRDYEHFLKFRDL